MNAEYYLFAEAEIFFDQNNAKSCRNKMGKKPEICGQTSFEAECPSNCNENFYWPSQDRRGIHPVYREMNMWDPFWAFGPMPGSGATEAADAANRANAAEMRVRELEHRVEKLALACNAMWDLLRNQAGITDRQLQEKIQQMDAADGVAGGSARNMVKCPGCGRQVSPRRGKCIYCGIACGSGSVFEER
jgi:hypothetical protein